MPLLGRVMIKATVHEAEVLRRYMDTSTLDVSPPNCSARTRAKYIPRYLRAAYLARGGRRETWSVS